jgi:hypothetical protein
MDLKAPLREILDIICELSKGDTEADVYDLKIYEISGLPKHEVDNYLGELSSLDLIAQRGPAPSGVDFRLFRLTKEGAKECSLNPAKI